MLLGSPANYIFIIDLPFYVLTLRHSIHLRAQFFFTVPSLRFFLCMISNEIQNNKNQYSSCDERHYFSHHITDFATLAKYINTLNKKFNFLFVQFRCIINNSKVKNEKHFNFYSKIVSQHRQKQR